MTGKEIIKILENHGWQVLRVSGSHYRMGKDNLRTTVPGKGLLKAIERQTKVKLT